MIVVLFELQAVEGQQQTYVDLVNKLTPLLEPMDGFIGVECFQSTVNPEKVLSVTTWRDEEAVVQWRNVQAHLSAQQAGRDKIFHDYRVRVTSVIRDYGLHQREQAPEDSLVGRHSG
ncbi:antibiotic biosynthesis monooxygenase family protein [Serratia sp. D1N4]